MSRLFSGLTIGASASALVLPMNIQDFRIDWFDCLAVQGTLKSSLTPQFKSINSSALSLLTVQLSHPYMTTGKTIALTRQTFVIKCLQLHESPRWARQRRVGEISEEPTRTLAHLLLIMGSEVQFRPPFPTSGQMFWLPGNTFPKDSRADFFLTFLPRVLQSSYHSSSRVTW